MAYLHDPEDHEEIGHGAALQAVWERRARQERADAQQAALPVQRLRPELHRYAPTGQTTGSEGGCRAALCQRPVDEPHRQAPRCLDTLPPISFPGRPERWWGDEALKAETDAPQATLKQRHQAAGDVLALRRRGFFSAGALFSMASHIPVETAQ